MKVKEAVVWWLVTEQDAPVLTDEDKKIESLMPLVSGMFPGINYYSITGFHEVMKECVMPALRKLFPQYLEGPAGKACNSEELIQVDEVLASDGYEWQDSPNWQVKFQEFLAAK